MGVYPELRGFILTNRRCTGLGHADVDPLTPYGYGLLGISVDPREVVPIRVQHALRLTLAAPSARGTRRWQPHGSPRCREGTSPSR